MNNFCFVGIYTGLSMLMLMMQSSIADDKLEIKVEGDKNMIIYVKDTDTVLKVKEKIVEKLNAEKKNDAETKILPERLTLRRCKNGSVFEDQKTMKDCEIGKDSVLFLTFDEFKICLYVKIKIFCTKCGPTVMLKGEDTVADVKSKIAEEMKIEPERITLRHKSEFEPPLEDSKIVKDYGIEKYSPIYLTLDEYEIFVHFNEQNYPIWVRKKDNVETLNKRVKRMLNKEFRIGFENIIPLKECDSAVCHMFMINRQTMKQERIIKDKVIYVDCELFLLELAIFDIFIEYKKKKYQVQVKGADTVLDLKTKIGNIQEIGILPNQQQKLICQKADGDEVLEDDSSIAYCKIAKNSTVFLTIAEMEQQEEKPSSSSKRQGEKKPSSSKKKKTAH